MPTTKGPDLAQPLSARFYALITLIGFVLGVGLLFVYIYEVPRLVTSGIGSQVFYLLLIPWALSCAAFLFGAMRSYARFTDRRLGSALELGGPVVLFGLVLVGGFKLVPPAPQTFDLTVRLHSADGRDPLINSGQVTIDLDTDRRTQFLGPGGEADFKGIPPRFEGTALRVLPQVDGYEARWQQVQLRGHVLDLPLDRLRPTVTVLTGSLNPPPAAARDFRILVEGQKGEASPDEFGRFQFEVNGKPGDRVRLKVYRGRQLLKDDFFMLPGPAEITLDRTGLRPGG